ncbi:ubiquinol-cytochrome C chaperone family protein [Sphingomonas sp. GCM10030256]|uniref:ubiquinol-cytochrome C chaperone family protein n=1 Tax=Sphingomonas sp. GCM10030256 TaxID=3273427 RepID=UPI0036236491
MRSLMRLFRSEPSIARPLYDAVVARARQPRWFREAGVPDTVEGRFCVLTTLLALVDLRLEGGEDEARRLSVGLSECFIDDMTGELRQMGVGDPVVSKRVGGLVGALGGRVGAWRRVMKGEESWAEVVGRSVFRGSLPSEQAGETVERWLRDFWAALQSQPDEALASGVLP